LGLDQQDTTIDPKRKDQFGTEKYIIQTKKRDRKISYKQIFYIVDKNKSIILISQKKKMVCTFKLWNRYGDLMVILSKMSC